MSVFDELLAIKRFREGQAELAVARQRQLHAQAETAQEKAEDDLRQYLGWARQRERDMYQDLCSRTVRVREIEDVLAGVADLRQGEQRQHEHVAEARKHVAREAEALAARRVDHRDASRMTEKFVELAQMHLDAHLKELERKEDLEMEEAASVARDREDWESHEEYEPS
ncbi:type III secretion system stalk subunit SctO [Bordetella genomosp. 13]|uniref:type III secretion system stalk subunit SctO n=1 Tax=Bordetella genomosp. 13 TaxID=463040 RepID=UPI0011A6A03A|nr:YscO family type III secretion system apparatus protein [Bordetella genomosp. 13]